MNWSGVLVQDGFWFSYVFEVLSRIGASVSFLAWSPFSELVMRQKSTSTPDVFLLGDEFLHCMSFFGGWIIGLHSGMGVFTVV